MTRFSHPVAVQTVISSFSNHANFSTFTKPQSTFPGLNPDTGRDGDTNQTSGRTPTARIREETGFLGEAANQPARKGILISMDIGLEIREEEEEGHSGTQGTGNTVPSFLSLGASIYDVIKTWGFFDPLPTLCQQNLNYLSANLGYFFTPLPPSAWTSHMEAPFPERSHRGWSCL